MHYTLISNDLKRQKHSETYTKNIFKMQFHILNHKLADVFISMLIKMHEYKSFEFLTGKS